jgi:zinc transporter ZupT
MATLSQILGLTLIPIFATVLGGAIATFRTPSEKLRSRVQHFAAGVGLAVVAGELLPDMTKEHRPLGVVIGFVPELLCLGISVAASLAEAKFGRTRSIAIIAGLASLVIVGALLGGSLLGGLSGLGLEIVLSFGVAALMYLVVEELLTKAHEVQETPLITAAFFAGFVALYLLELMA